MSNDTALIVRFIADQPGMAAKLLAQHVNDGTGHCKICTNGAGAGRHVWPCPSHGLAEQASQLGPR